MPDVQTGARWYVFQTRHNTEFLAERQLQRQRFETFVPSVIVDKTRKGVVIGQEKRALFRSYGFVRFDVSLDHWRPIASTYGVKRLFGITPERPICLPVGVIESLQAAMLVPLTPIQDVIATPAPDTILVPLPVLDPNEVVEVIAGPMGGHIGIVQYSEHGRVVLLMDILQSQVPVSFKLVNVRKLTDQSDATQTVPETA